MAQQWRDRNGQLDRQRVSRAAAAYERIAEAWAKDSDDMQIEAWYKWALTLIERSRTETGLEAAATRGEARKILLRALGALRDATARAAADTAGRLSPKAACGSLVPYCSWPRPASWTAIAPRPSPPTRSSSTSTRGSLPLSHACRASPPPKANLRPSAIHRPILLSPNEQPLLLPL